MNKKVLDLRLSIHRSYNRGNLHKIWPGANNIDYFQVVVHSVTTNRYCFRLILESSILEGNAGIVDFVYELELFNSYQYLQETSMALL